jgi:hypothetical protein
MAPYISLKDEFGYKNLNPANIDYLSLNKIKSEK